MMKNKNILGYKIRGLSDPDSVLFKIAPTLKLTGGSSFTRELFHMNAIQEIPANESEKKDIVFRKGNILLSFCNYSDSIASFIAIVDPVSYNILWYYVQKDRKQMHTPAMLPNGHILIYVNTNGHKNDYSFIEEIDPVTKEIVWKYTEKFLKVNNCNEFGSCQRLPDGNTLISNCNGYIYEVTPDKKIVWKWVANETSERSTFLYRAFLYPKENLNWLINEK
jgi:outer membrane protein assembly factor BamB